MWRAARRVLLGIGALLGVLVYSLQFKKACEDASPSQCIMSFIEWAGHGKLTPRQDVASVPPKTPVPGPPAKVAESPKPPTEPLGIMSKQVPRNDDTASVKAERVTREPPREGRGRRLTLINAGDMELVYFYATSCNDKQWGRDLLGANEMVSPGRRRDIQLWGDCCFDLRAKFRDMARRDQNAQRTQDVVRSSMGVDICRFGSWTVSNRD